MLGWGFSGAGAADQTAVKARSEVRQPLAKRRDPRAALQERQM